MVKVMEAPHYRSCNSCGSGDRVIEITVQTAEQRAEILLKAAYDILKKCEESPYVLDILSVTAIWDDAECDGSCLKDDIVAWFSEYRGIELEHWNGIRK